jgi:hypothetical protein
VENDLCFEIIDSTILADMCDLCLKSRATSTGQPPWSPTDPVHLTSDGYWDLAAAIGDTMLSSLVGNSASTSSCGSDSQKRRVLDSVITGRLHQCPIGAGLQWHLDRLGGFSEE